MIASAAPEVGDDCHGLPLMAADCAPRAQRLMFGRVDLAMMDPAWHRSLHKLDKITHYPPELLMVHRVALILRGLSVALRQNLSIAEAWRPHAAACLRVAEGDQGRSSPRVAEGEQPAPGTTGDQAPS